MVKKACGAGLAPLFMFLFVLLCAACCCSVSPQLAWADALQVSPSSITLYALDDSYKGALSTPSDLPQSSKIEVSGADSPKFQLENEKRRERSKDGTMHNDYISVSPDGTVKPYATAWYWKNGMGTTSPIEGVDPTYEYEFGKTKVTVVSGNQKAEVTVEVRNYAQIYGDQQIDAYLAQHVTDSMSVKEKVEQCAKYAASFKYDYRYQSACDMIIYQGGDCWASTNLIVAMCKKMGIPAWARNGNRDAGAGSGHMNAMVQDGDRYYEVEAGYGTTEVPRPYDVRERTSLYSYRVLDSSAKTIEVYQYDAQQMPETLDIPEKIDGYTVVKIGDSFAQYESVKHVNVPSTVTSIGQFAFWNSDLVSFAIPASVSSIGIGAFTSCNDLTGFQVAAGNASFSAEGGALYDAAKTKLISAPAVAELSIPDGVTIIGNMALRYNSKLTRLEIPASVTTIEEDALANIGKADLYFKGSSAPTCDANAFYRNSKETVVHHGLRATGFDGSVWKDMTVVGPDVSEADVALAYTSASYSGKPCEPAVTASCEGEALVAGTDFEVSYEDNVAPGQAKAVVKGIGRMSGTRTLTFEILPVQLDDSMVGKIPSATYSGKEIRPAVTLTDGGKTLVAGKDYDVSYSDNVNAGTATVKVTGKGNYAGEAAGSFVIKAATLQNARVSIPDQTYDGEALEPALDVRLGDRVLKAGTDYIATYSDNVEPGTATATITAKEPNYTGTRTLTFEISPRPIDSPTVSVLLPDAVPYMGKPVEPKVTVEDKDLGKVLSEGADYSVSFSHNVGAGVAGVRIAGKGHYRGTRDATFNIAVSKSDQQAVEAFERAVEALGSEVSSDADSDAVDRARADYEALTDAQRSLVSDDAVDKLGRLELSAQERADKQQAEQEKAEQERIAREKAEQQKADQQEKADEPASAEDPKPDADDQPARGGSDSGSDKQAETPGGSDAAKNGSGQTQQAGEDVAKHPSKKAVTLLVLNAKTVDAKAVKKAAKKAGATLSKVRTVTLGKKVRTLKKGAFKGCGAKTLVVETRRLAKKSVRGSLKGSKVKTVKVSVGSKKLNRRYAKSWKKLFAAKNCGRKVAVKAA